MGAVRLASSRGLDRWTKNALIVQTSANGRDVAFAPDEGRPPLSARSSNRSQDHGDA